VSPLLTSFAISVLLCAGLLCFPIRWLGRDDPAGLARKEQKHPIPTVGLLVPTLALLVLGSFAWAAGLCLAILALLGWLDDRLGTAMPWIGKLTAQVIVLGLFFLVLVPAQELDFIERSLPLLCGLLLLTAWNIYDNFDGALAWMALASLGSIVLLHGSWGSLPRAGAVLAAALLAFLPFNWPRARLYLGDAGSQAIGFALLLLSLGMAVAPDASHPSPLLLQASTPRPWLLFLLPHMVPLIDLFQVATGRLLRGRPPWVGDRMHLSHLLERHACPRALVAPLLASLQILLTLACRQWLLG